MVVCIIPAAHAKDMEFETMEIAPHTLFKRAESTAFTPLSALNLKVPG